MLAQWQDVSLSFPDKPVLDHITWRVDRGDKVALVGENGAGKTCLFHILLGELSPDSGRAVLAQGVRVAYLNQNFVAEIDEKRAVMDVAAEPFAPLQADERRLSELQARLAAAPADAQALQALGETMARFEAGGGYGYRARIEAVLNGVGLGSAEWRRKAGELSAGQKVRLALAQLLLRDADLLLLDEPTNHLDLAAREWLEAYLHGLETAYVVVSHDRRFLDAVATRVAHLDRTHLQLYRGNYTAFRAQIEAREAADWATYEKSRREVRKLENQARAYRTWSNRREGDKIGGHDKGYIGHKAAKLMKRAITAERRLDATINRMKVQKPFEKDPVAIDFQGAEGRRLLRVEGLSVGYEAPLQSGLSFELAAGERLALLGPNGCGKSTLLATLLGEQAPLDGRIWWSSAADIGRFDQELSTLNPEATARAAAMAGGIEETLARTVMGRLRIRRDTAEKPIAQLSVGEKAKVLLTRLILGGHNVLVLDEPTNHLDMETQDVLLEALAEFPGGILFVSHDRHFIDELATGLIELEPASLRNSDSGPA